MNHKGVWRCHTLCMDYSLPAGLKPAVTVRTVAPPHFMRNISYENVIPQQLVEFYRTVIVKYKATVLNR